MPGRADKTSLYVGPTLSVNYGIQNYPDMHNGHLNWMTNYSLGIHVLGLTSIRGRRVKLQMRSSTFNLISRPKLERDPHYFSLRIGDIIANTHRGLRLVSLDICIQTEFSAEMMVGDRSSLSYQFQYLSYSESPEFKQLFHGLRYTRYFGRVEW